MIIIDSAKALAAAEAAHKTTYAEWLPRLAAADAAHEAACAAADAACDDVYDAAYEAAEAAADAAFAAALSHKDETN
jgi:hypothetical protein